MTEYKPPVDPDALFTIDLHVHVEQAQGPASFLIAT
jgi:hypothetical protein